MKNLLSALAILFLLASPVWSAQKTVTVGTSGSPASLDTNFGNIQDNFTEVYGTFANYLLTSSISSTYAPIDDPTFTTKISAPYALFGTASTTQGYVGLYSNGSAFVTYILPGAATEVMSFRLPASPAGGSNYLLNVSADGTMDYTNPTAFQAATITASGFDGNLATTDDTLQEVAQKVDDLVVTGGSAADDTAYNATSWDNNSDAATKNAIRDKIETLGSAGEANETMDSTPTDGNTDHTVSSDGIHDALAGKQDTITVEEVSADVATMMGSADNAAILSNIGAQTSDADLTAIAALSCTDGQVAVKASGVWACGSASSSDTLSDLSCSTDQIAKWNGTSWACAADSTAAGAGYVSTVPTYSDEACTAGQYAFSTSTGYVCVSSGDWNTFSLTNWDNATPTTYALTMTITDTTGTGSTFTVNSDAADVDDSPKTWSGLSSATQAITFTPNDDETAACTGTGVPTDGDGTIDMSSADVTAACTVSAASSLLLDETFSVASLPSGWSASSGVDFNGTTATIDTEFETLTSPTLASPTSVKFRQWMPTGGYTATNDVIHLRNGTTDVVTFGIQSSDRTVFTHGATFDYGSASFVMIENSYNYVWIDYIPGTGVNGVAEVSVSVIDSKPAVPQMSITTGTATLAIDNILFEKGGASAPSTVIEFIQADDGEIDG